MKVILVLVLAISGHETRETHYPMPSMKECLKSVENAAINVSNGAENEQSVSLFCAYGNVE